LLLIDYDDDKRRFTDFPLLSCFYNCQRTLYSLR
jgi:hypothetical protein